MQDEAYAALMASPTSTAAFLPKPTPMSELLPSAIVSRLEDSRSLVGTDKPQWDMVLHQLEANGGLEGMVVSDVNGLILCMDIRSRAEFSSKVCELMLKASLEPDTFTYDLLMLAHAELTQPLRVRELFQDLKKSKSQSLVTFFPYFFFLSPFSGKDSRLMFLLGGISPTVYTYAHLLKAYACEADVTSAAEAFRQMHQSGVTPNTVPTLSKLVNPKTA
jgi:pentatricopeptide repeat protein